MLTRDLLRTAAVLAILLPGAGTAEEARLVDSVFQDHMVLQRDLPIRIWGSTQDPLKPGESVIVELDGQQSIATVDENGSWSLQLDPRPAGGPYELVIESKKGRQTLSDVLIGDVFLCSGQSNMEMTVVRARNSWAEVEGASNDRIRMTKVERATSAQPEISFLEPLTWEPATRETVGDWSAVCYFFAREIQKHMDVPIGLIDSSWGGSDIRAWMSADSLGEIGGYEEALESVRLFAIDESAAQEHFGTSWEDWWRRSSEPGTIEPWRPETGTSWSMAPETLGNWKTWGRPELETHDGLVWYRGIVEVAADHVDQPATLVLGGVDEADQTWINGHVVGSSFGWGDTRRYEIPAGWLRQGENVVVSAVFSAWDFAGLVGDVQRELEFHGPSANTIETAPLIGWRYRKATEGLGHPPMAPWGSIFGRTAIHNAMIAPLRNLSLRAVLWYQGEANIGQGSEYAMLLSSLIRQWRTQLRNDLPVLVVQLAGFGPRPTKPLESGWAELREAQRHVARDDPQTGLAVAIDLGEIFDVHPTDKQEVGRRLARAARNLVYGEAITRSGPEPSRIVRADEALRIEFEEVDGSLLSHGHTRPIGFELCGGPPGSCRYAEARIEGHGVVLEGAKASDTRIRYCWADHPICTLYDEADLPAQPFELSIESVLSSLASE